MPRNLSIHAAVQAKYDSASVAGRVGRRQGSELHLLKGVKQGCSLSPSMFGLSAYGLNAFLQALATTTGFAVANDVRHIIEAY